MKPLAVDLKDGAYSIPGPARLLKCSTEGPTGGQVSIWLPSAPQDSVQWEKVVAIPSGAEQSSLFRTIERLLSGATVFFEGDLQHISDFLEEVYRILSGTGMSDEALWSYFCNCTIAMKKERLVGVRAKKVSFSYWHWVLRPIVLESYKTTTYLPAYLVSVIRRDVFGSINFNQWLKSRFVPGKTDVPVMPVGNFLTVDREVFVPDPVILDLFGSAYYAPHSPLPQDIWDAVVAEPCTGSGVLAIMLIQLGARKVICTDTHAGSVRCAKQNIERFEMNDRILVQRVSGLPQNVEPTLIMTNPPWYGGEDQLEAKPLYHKRCFEDPGHELLRSLLQSAAVCTGQGTPFYVFLGADDPFGNSRSASHIDCEAFGWRLDNYWIGDRGLRLYRLQRD